MCDVREIEVTRLSSGWIRVSGPGPCNWAQVPYFSVTMEELEEYSFPEASQKFVNSAYRVLNQDTRGVS